jgi:hypothetical protein
MTEKQRFILQVIAGLCANPHYYHDVVAPHKDFAKTVFEDAKAIANEVFKDSDDSPSA